MTMQSQVSFYPVAGVQGDKATATQSFYTPQTFVSEGVVTVGHFAFAGTDPEMQATCVAGSDTMPLGLVERVINAVNPEAFSNGTLNLPEGTPLSVAVAGDYWVVSTTAATAGQSVFAATANGSIATGSTPASGFVETGWKVRKGGAVGDAVLISSFLN